MVSISGVSQLFLISWNSKEFPVVANKHLHGSRQLKHVKQQLYSTSLQKLFFLLLFLLGASLDVLAGWAIYLFIYCFTLHYSWSSTLPTADLFLLRYILKKKKKKETSVI